MAAGRLKVQRTGLFLYMSLGVALLAYALGFVTDIYLFYAYGNQELVGFYREMQGTNTGLLWKAVGVIVFTVILFILELRNRAAGIFTLAAALLFSALGVFFSVDSVLRLSDLREKYGALDLSSLQRYIEQGTIKYSFSTLTYDLGFAVNILFICSSLFLGAVIFYNATCDVCCDTCRAGEPVPPEKEAS
jgi:hypothetical protein